ncbi:semaphorin-1A [Caerostris extrusa]|uniref:Semaphorin-1A n=1 Tax=Caerostris extrusa TaxID=172846 RepID=A0AAV4XQ56_CAEEX|nr:semaphorin-1A [Caerostris extrusa]
MSYVISNLSDEGSFVTGRFMQRGKKKDPKPASHFVIAHKSTSHIVDGLYGGKPAQLIYAVFTTPTNSISGSAVCAFRLEDILKTFDGAFKGHEDVNFNWLPVQNSKVPEPRPGQCVNDSRTLPEQTVNFIKNHNLMDQSVPAFWGKPIVIYTGFKYRYTYIAVGSLK